MRRTTLASFGAGAASGALSLAVMYLLASVAGLTSLPQALQEPVLAHVPGWLFGLLIDRLQHAGKVLEEIGMMAAWVLLGALLAVALDLLRRPFIQRQRSLAAALALYLAVSLGLLPAARLGWFGLAEGVQAVFEWALVCLAYGVSLQLLQSRSRPAPETSDRASDPARRRLVFSLPLAVAALSLGAVALMRLPTWLAGLVNQGQSGRATEAITPVADFYRVSKNFNDPRLEATGFTLRVQGLLARPRSYRLDDLALLSQSREVVTLECVSNPVGGGLISTGVFGGVALRELLLAAQPLGEARAVDLTAADGYEESLSLSRALADQAILVATSLDGAPLPAAHGYPARIVFPGHYGMRGPKWLTSISVVKSEATGFWEAQGWGHEAVVRTMSRIDSPQDGAIVPAGAPVSLSGVAFAGDRGISAVEWSDDGGGRWHAAELEVPLSPYAWTLWRGVWTSAEPGARSLVVRARDGSGRLQDPAPRPSFPGGSTGYQRITVNLA